MMGESEAWIALATSAVAISWYQYSGSAMPERLRKTLSMSLRLLRASRKGNKKKK